MHGCKFQRFVEKKVLNYHSCLTCFWKNGFEAKIDSFYSLSANINSLGRITGAKCCKSTKVKLTVKVSPDVKILTVRITGQGIQTHYVVILIRND